MELRRSHSFPLAPARRFLSAGLFILLLAGAPPARPAQAIQSPVAPPFESTSTTHAISITTTYTASTTVTLPFHAPPVESAPKPPATAPITATITSATTITGHLLRPGGAAPAAGASVTLIPWPRPSPTLISGLLLTTTTTPEGAFHFSLEPAPANNFRLAVKGSGLVAFATQEFTGQPKAPLRLELPAAEGWIKGRVLDSHEHPLGHGEVKAYNFAGHLWATVAVAPVNREGEFLLGPMAPGKYSLFHSLGAPAFTNAAPVQAEALPRNESGKNPITLSSDRAEFPCQEFLVTKDNGFPCSRYTIDLQGQTTSGQHIYRTVESCQAEDAGPGQAFAFDIPAGDYVGLVRTTNASEWVRFHFDPKSPVPPLRVRLARRQPLSILLRYPNGKPAAGCILTLTNPRDPRKRELPFLLAHQLITDGQGVARCGFLPDGRYAITLTDAQNRPHELPPFTVKADHPTSQSAVFLRRDPASGPAPWLVGKVVDTQGRPLEGVSLCLFPSMARVSQEGPGKDFGPSRTVTTERDGIWRFQLDPPANPQSTFQIMASHPDCGPELYPSLTQREIRGKPLVMRPSAGFKVELYAEKTADTADLQRESISVTLSYDKVPDPFNFSVLLMLSSVTQLRPVKTEPFHYEFKQVCRGIPYTLRAGSIRWASGEPVIFENGREVGRGKTVKLPETGEPDWVIRVPLHRRTSADARASGNTVTLGGKTYHTMPGWEVRLKLRDALTSMPLEGIRIGGPMLAPATGSFSDANGMVTATIASFARDPLLFLGQNLLPLSASPGNILSGTTLLLPRDLARKPWEPPTIEISAVRLLSQQSFTLRLIDGMGHPIEEGITLVDGPLRIPMHRPTGEIPEYMIPRPTRTGPGLSSEPAWNQIRIGQWRPGKARIYFASAARAAEPFTLTGYATPPGLTAATDDQGHPCLDVDFSPQSADHGSYETTICLTDYLVIPQEKNTP